MKIKCELRVYPGTVHINQIVTGFLLLKEQNLIDLDIKIDNPQNRKLSINNVEVLINDKIKIVYDLLDGYNFGEKNLDNYLDEVDLYFKRSFNKEENIKFKNYKKIQPLGFNYWITTNGNILDSYNRYQNNKLLIKNINIINNLYKKKEITHFKNFEQLPYINKNPKILFLARTWEPSNEISNEENEERHNINRVRAECIRELKKEFGNNFVGGFSNTPYTFKNFKDCINANISTNKINFMKQIKKSDICIATLGLHKSNGWKIGEYIAASQAIVSEKMYYEVPGNFKKGSNYLEFNNVNELIQSVNTLYYDNQKLYEMKINNFEYYNRYLRPDMLILNTLVTAIKLEDMY